MSVQAGHCHLEMEVKDPHMLQASHSGSLREVQALHRQRRGAGAPQEAQISVESGLIPPQPQPHGKASCDEWNAPPLAM